MTEYYRQCPAGCDLGERDDGNYRWDCDRCGGMAFIPVNEPLLSRVEWEATMKLPSRDDLRDIAESAGVSRATLFWILDELRAAAKGQT